MGWGEVGGVVEGEGCVGCPRGLNGLFSFNKGSLRREMDACILAVLLKLRDEGNQTGRDERKCSRL